jgi:hypothetical protein
VRLVDSDSVSLTVDLADSIITIEQKGVVLHTASINAFNISHVFKRIDRNDLSMALAVPLTIKESVSTIARKRYNVKIAPSDTSNSAPMVTPDTLAGDAVCFRFGLDRGIQLEVRQSEDTDNKTIKEYNSALNRNEYRRILSDLFAFRVPEYHPVIQIELGEKDARAIYKALPVHAKIALRI